MEPQQKFQQLKESVVAGNVPQIILSMISYALDMRSSDIHMQPERSKVKIRYRVDGVLRPIIEYPTNMHPALVSRVKIMSNLKIDEQRIPQDGRTEVATKDGREMDLRISVLPTVNGEKVVMRIQDKSRKIPSLDELGIEGNNMVFLKRGLEAPNGVILNSGPTGSGKTTTLYACLNLLNTSEVNILTIEDPVEIQMEGLNQSQVHPEINYNFAFGLRTALRQDPDIIMVGEIRDKETIDVAIEASLTGHLVLSTIHTNSAAETITRIGNMGIPPYLMADTIQTIIAQRLVRKICEKCREQISVSDEMKERVKKAIKNLNVDESKLVFYRGKGCEACENVGYHGRTGIYEVMEINNRLRKLILDRASSLDIENAAKENGMLTLEQDGVLKVIRGITTLEEIYNVARQGEI